MAAREIRDMLIAHAEFMLSFLSYSPASLPATASEEQKRTYKVLEHQADCMAKERHLVEDMLRELKMQDPSPPHYLELNNIPPHVPGPAQQQHS